MPSGEKFRLSTSGSELRAIWPYGLLQGFQVGEEMNIFKCIFWCLCSYTWGYMENKKVLHLFYEVLVNWDRTNMGRCYETLYKTLAELSSISSCHSCPPPPLPYPIPATWDPWAKLNYFLFPRHTGNCVFPVSLHIFFFQEGLLVHQHRASSSSALHLQPSHPFLGDPCFPFHVCPTSFVHTLWREGKRARELKTGKCEIEKTGSSAGPRPAKLSQIGHPFLCRHWGPQLTVVSSVTHWDFYLEWHPLCPEMLSRPFWKDLAQLDNPHPTAETTHKPPATPKAQLSSGCVVIGDRDVSSLGWMFFGTAAVHFHFSVFDA